MNEPEQRDPREVGLFRFFAKQTVFTNLATVFVLVVVAWSYPLGKFMGELTHDFDGPIEGMVTYLNEHGDPNDVVVITYGDMPLKFYTKMRVLGGLTGEAMSPARNADWVIVRQYQPAADKTRRVFEWIRDNIDSDQYEAVTVPYPDTYWENREEPAVHYFVTQRRQAPLLLWKRRTSVED